MNAAVTWRDDRACTLTFSLPGRLRARRAARAALRACAGGATLTRALGTWDGRSERAYALALVGRATPPLPILAALRSAGCVAIQVESWTGGRYSVREVRP